MIEPGSDFTSFRACPYMTAAYERAGGNLTQEDGDRTILTVSPAMWADACAARLIHLLLGRPRGRRYYVRLGPYYRGCFARIRVDERLGVDLDDPMTCGREVRVERRRA